MIDPRAAGLAIALLILPLTGCKIVQIADQETAAPAGFDANSYVAGLWESQALPHFKQSAKPVTEVLPAIASDFAAAGSNLGYRAGEGSPWSFVVTGTGKVVAKNTESRAGTLEVQVDGIEAPVVLQIGPVIRGNAVRDALPFVSFKNFTNQIEFANAGKALTATALAGFSPNVEAIKVGDTVRFTGALSLSSKSDAPLVTPIELGVAQ